MGEPAKSPTPQPASSGNKLDSLSKEDLIKFAKKQVINVTELKKNQEALVKKLKSRNEEFEELKKEAENLKFVNEKLALKHAENVENNPTECTECIKESERLIELEKQMEELKEKATKSDMLSLELRDLETQVDTLTRGLREKTEALVKAHDVISENDAKIIELRNDSSSKTSQLENLVAENKTIGEKLKVEIHKTISLEKQLKEAESKMADSKEKEGCEKLGLARQMAECENRSRLLEEAVDVLRSENIKLKQEAEEASSSLHQLQKEYAEFKNKARFVLEKKVKEEDDDKEAMEQIEKANQTICQLESSLEELKERHIKILDELSIANDNHARVQKELQAIKIANAETEKNHLKALDDVRMSNSVVVKRLEDDLLMVKSSRNIAEKKCKELEIGKEKLDHLLVVERQKSEFENQSLKRKLETASSELERLQKELVDLRAETEARASITPQHKAIAAVIPQQAATVEAHRILAPAMSDSISCHDEMTQPDRSLEDILYGEIEDPYKYGTLESDKDRIEALKTELENLRLSNSHISELLSEAESANGRLVSQNTLLKEEIRRLERKEGREEELSNEKNMEYLKNCIIQFMKHQCGQAERAQLIIVLQRVLHLSPQEVDVLKKAADHINSATTTGWSSYLTGWSS
ncbi:unnamed protein product [Caenorhabditis bovis]|uniref:GRIP domain-containing protein n=1 Tax=Caenorhabditis bovis TaxID=2654633 RepID=A0A8S1EJT2_9PELO|nr:unnamed protein product [Caenorhabditis bovis]